MSAMTHVALFLFITLLHAAASVRIAHAAETGLDVCVGVDDVKEMIASLSKLEEKWQQEAIVAHIMSERQTQIFTRRTQRFYALCDQ